MKLTDKLDQLMAERNINKPELSRGSGVPYTTIDNFYKKGTDNVKLSTLKKLSKFFGVSLDYLADDDEDDRFVIKEEPASYSVSDLVPVKLRKKIPVVGVIRAGEPILAEQNIIGNVELPAEFINSEAEYFGLRIIGDSMNLSRIYEGDIVIVKKQGYVENGEIAVVLVDGENATVKKFHQTGTMVTLIPNSNNSIHVPKVYDLTKVPVAVLGKVVKAIIDF